MKEARAFPRWLCLGFAGLALATLASRAWMDIQQGTLGMVRWSDDWLLQAGVMTLPSLYVVSLALGGGYCLKTKSRAVALMLYVGVGTFLFFTSTNNLDFLANKTINVAEAEKARATEQRDITAIQNEHALKDREEAKENLWRTYTAAKKPEERARAFAEYKKFTEDPVPLKPLEVASAKGAGDLLERWTGIKSRTWAEAKTLALPLGFMVFEIVLLSLAISRWPRKEVLPGENGGNPGHFPSTSKTVPIPKMTKEQALALVRLEHPKNRTAITTAFVAEKCGVTQKWALHWMRQWEREGHVGLSTRHEKMGCRPTTYVKSVTPVLVSNNDLKASA